ncbi:MAG: DUF4860 domain-containing protein [Clostridia bacterium]|nr:DUF4860 domain-containing protein [Clostridia bacterium]NCC42570.1 DUF4860 domain-containing protein [Clostridia bacterium]
MRLRNTQHHVIDVMFTIALFCFFALSALTVIITGANSYQHITGITRVNYNLRTSLSYITQKVRLMDQEGSVQLGSLDGIPALVLYEDFDGTSYCTYIYPYEQQLKELFVREDADLDASSGKSILEIGSCEFEQISADLISVEASDIDGNRQRILINSACKGGTDS